MKIIQGALIVGSFLISATDARAMPAFARATGSNCTACHTAYPELNATGEMYRDHGFRFEPTGAEPWDWNDMATFLKTGAPPLGIRASVYYSVVNDRSLTPDDADYKRITNSFQPAGAAILIAGNLVPHFSVWFDHDFGTGNSANEAYLRVNAIGTELFSVRAGSFELDIPFTVAKTQNVFDYLIYDIPDAAGSLDPFTFGEPQIGVEVSGHHESEWFRYSAALVNGSNNTPATNSYKSGYGRVRFGGYKYRVGLAAYDGSYGIAPLSGGLTNGYRTDHVQRTEADFEMHVGWWRVFALYMIGFNDAAIAANGKLNSYRHDGGFAQAEYLWNKPHLQFALRYDQVRSRQLQKLAVWNRDREQAVTPQVIFMMRPDVQLKTAFQMLQDPADKRVYTLQTGIDWAVY